jgi:hypothetical protein
MLSPVQMPIPFQEKVMCEPGVAARAASMKLGADDTQETVT